MANIFGIEDEENFGLINKMSQILTNNKKNDFVNSQKLLLNETIGVKEVNRSHFVNKSDNETLFPINLSNIEINKSSNENFLSTDRGKMNFDKKLQVLKGNGINC
jgi:hypothetical protein